LYITQARNAKTITAAIAITTQSTINPAEQSVHADVEEDDAASKSNIFS
jgi:hypothetical protein